MLVILQNLPMKTNKFKITRDSAIAEGLRVISTLHWRWRLCKSIICNWQYQMHSFIL